MIQSPHTLKPFCQTPKMWRFVRKNLGLHSHLPPCETIDDGRLSNLRYQLTDQSYTWEGCKNNSNRFYLPLRRLGNAGVFICSSFGFCVKHIWKWPFYVLHVNFGHAATLQLFWNDKIIWGQDVGAANPQLQGDHHPCIQNQQIKWATKKKKKNVLSMKSWLFYRDPYNGLL